MNMTNILNIMEDTGVDMGEGLKSHGILFILFMANL